MSNEISPTYIDAIEKAIRKLKQALAFAEDDDGEMAEKKIREAENALHDAGWFGGPHPWDY